MSKNEFGGFSKNNLEKFEKVRLIPILSEQRFQKNKIFSDWFSTFFRRLDSFLFLL